MLIVNNNIYANELNLSDILELKREILNSHVKY